MHFPKGRELPLDITRALDLLRHIAGGEVFRENYPVGYLIKNAWPSSGNGDISFCAVELDRLAGAGMASFGPVIRSKKYRKGNVIITQAVRIQPAGIAFMNSNVNGWQRLPILREVWDTDGWQSGSRYRLCRMRFSRYFDSRLDKP